VPIVILIAILSKVAVHFPADNVLPTPKNRFLAASSDAPEQWLAQLRRLIDEPAVRTDVARRCARRAQQYTSTLIAQQYLEQHGQLVARKSVMSRFAEVP